MRIIINCSADELADLRRYHQRATNTLPPEDWPLSAKVLDYMLNRLPPKVEITTKVTVGDDYIGGELRVSARPPMKPSNREGGDAFTSAPPSAAPAPAPARFDKHETAGA